MGLVVAHRYTLVGALIALVLSGCTSKSALEAPAPPSEQPVTTDTATDSGATDAGGAPDPSTAATVDGAEATPSECADVGDAQEPSAAATADEAEAPPAESTDVEDVQGPSAMATEDEPEVPNPCDQEDTEGWLDKSQEWIYETVCGSAMWFDGFFGNARADERSSNTFGRIGLSSFWDQRDGFDTKLRFRAKFALPSASNRASLMVGRGNEDEIIEERTTQMDTIPGNFNNIGDDSFMIGLGYSRGKGLNRGFKVSVGAKIRAPPEPYVKLRYTRAFNLTDSTLMRLRPILYWKTDEKFGATMHVDFDQLLNDRMMLRWANYANAAESKEIRGVEWESSLYLFQALSNRKALTYRTMVLGATGAEEPLLNYGVELRFRQRVFREWLFLELLTSLTWPKEFLTEERDANFGIGAGFEMYFGPAPDYFMR